MDKANDYFYFDLREPFYGAADLPINIEKEIEKNVGEGGPYLRYKKEILKPREEFINSQVHSYPDDYESPTLVKLKLTSRRFFTFTHVGGPIEVIFSDGTIRPVTGDSIELPQPYQPCDSETWQSWKKFAYHYNYTITNIHTFDTGIVVIEYFWLDCNIYTMTAYKSGTQFAYLKRSENCDAGRDFFDEMMHSDDSEPFVTKMKQMYR